MIDALTSPPRTSAEPRAATGAADAGVRQLALSVNGQPVVLSESDAHKPLLWVLRETLGLRGTKYGCGHGGCGACAVLLDGQAVNACMLRADEAGGKQVVTIEGLAEQRDHPVFRAWLAEQVPQCGYCQPGMVITAAALLARTPHPTDADIDAAFAHMLCRCGAYPRVRRALHRAAEQRWDDAPFPATALPRPPAPPAGRAAVFNPWIGILPDGVVQVTLGRSEMGQGIATALPMLIAEELEVPLDRLRVAFAPADPVYNNPVIGQQITVGSMSVENAWEPLRRAGAEVRDRLIVAAARKWRVSRRECFAENGTIVHRPTGRQFGYGTLAGAAAALPRPRSVRLKAPNQFRLIGKPTARLEAPAHIAGRTVFGTDVVLPRMLVATVLMPPAFGAKPARIDESRARAVPGVRDVLAITGGLAIVADDMWSALKGRSALDVTWESGVGDNLSSAAIFERFRSAAAQPGEIDRNDGDVDRALARAANVRHVSAVLPSSRAAPRGSGARAIPAPSGSDRDSPSSAGPSAG